MAHFGELLAELRQDHGLTQDQLAEIINASNSLLSRCANVMLSISISPTPRTNLEMKERMPLRK